MSPIPLGILAVAGSGGAGMISTISYTGTLSPRSIAVDASDNVYIAGHLYTSFNRVWVAKLPPTLATFTYQQVGSDSNHTVPYSKNISIDSSGQLLYGSENSGMTVVGSSGANVLNGDVNNTGASVNAIYSDGSGNAIMNVATNGANAITMKSSASTGAVVWQRKITSALGGDTATGSGVDSAYNTYNTFYNQYGTTWAYKYNTSGTIQWQRLLTNANSPYAVTTHASTGDTYIITGPTNPIIWKLNSAGTYQWSKAVANTYLSQGTSISTDAAGNVYVVLQTTTSGQNVIFKYDSSGNLVWTRQISATATFFVIGAHVKGSFLYLVLQGSSTITIAKLPTDGSKQGVYTVGGRTYTYNATTVATQSARSDSVSASGLAESANTTGTWVSRANTWSGTSTTIATAVI